MTANDFIFGLIVGALLGLGAALFAAENVIETKINRALSCMSTGNTVEQCKDILGTN